MTRLYNLSDILPTLADHAIKHQNEFANSSLSTVKQAAFQNVGDSQKHLQQVLYHPNTKSFTGADNRDFFFNKELKTFIVINPNKDSQGKIYGGTTVRSITGNGPERTYNKAFDEESRRLGKPPIEHQKDGILALQPDIAREHLDQQKQSPEAKVAADKIAGQNDQQKNQDKGVSAHKTPEVATHQGQDKSNSSQQQNAAQGKNIPPQSETKNPETQKSAAGKPETVNQTKRPDQHQPATDQLAAQKTQQDKMVAASGGGEAKTSASSQQNTAEGQGKATQPQVVSKPETVNQSKPQELGKGQIAGEKATTHPASEAKNSPTGEPTKPDQQVTPQQPSSEAKTNQAAVSQSQSPQSAGRSEALQKIYDRQQPNQSERMASTQSAAEQKTGPENQQNQQSARVGNKDQAAVKDQSSQPDQQVTQQKTDAASPKENTQQLSPAQQPQSVKAEEGKAEKQEQSGQSQALQDMYQRQEQQQAQATEAPQQQSSAPEMG